MNARPWRRHRFKTSEGGDDYRPVKFNAAYPWWCSGFAGDGSYSVIVAYLPATEDLRAYWPDAFDVETTEEEGITFTDRFPRPAYFEVAP